MKQMASVVGGCSDLGKSQEQLEAELSAVKKHSQQLFRIWRRRDTFDETDQKREPAFAGGTKEE